MNTRLLLGAVLSLCACAHRPAQGTALSARRSQPLQLGAMKVWALRDGGRPLGLSLLKGIEPADAKRMLAGDSVRTPYNAFLVQLNGKIVLVDSGKGQEAGRDNGHLPEQLAAAGVDPSQVDLILVTHFHFDHIGGLVKPDGTRAFPNAIVRVPRAEYDHWLGESAQVAERLRGQIPKIKAVLAAYQAAGAFQLLEADEEVGPGIRALAAHGHTAGHTVYAFASEGQELWCVGDLIHFSAVQFERPEAWVSFDLDGAMAASVRQDFFWRAAQAKVVLAGAHLPELVRLEAKGTGFAAMPAARR